MSELVEVRACRVEGCNAPANERYFSGPYSGFCETHIIDRREELSSAASERHRERRERIEWTAESVIEAILAWAREHGRFPRSSEWQRARNGEHRPTYDGVLRIFDGWREALAAAGFPKGAMIDDVAVAPDGTINLPLPSSPGQVRDAGNETADEEQIRERLGFPQLPDPGVEPEPESLADLAERYEAAREQHAATREALDEAAAALREHPLVAELFSGRELDSEA